MATRVDELERLLRRITDAAYSVACESNGIGDNEWTLADGTQVKCEFPISSWTHAMRRLAKAREAAYAYLNPEENEKSEKWTAACAIASAIVKRSRESGAREGNLVRNIADAIHGSLNVGDDGSIFTTGDRLAQLTAEGRLHELKPLGGK